MGAGGGSCSTLILLRLRRVLVDAYVFSRFYWPAAAADAGGAEWERREGVAGELYCTDEGEESGFSFFFLSIEAGDVLSQPAGRRTQARGAGHGPERRVRTEARTRFYLSFMVP